MTKNKLSIRNPLTLIAIFSMLTEASAAVSLPYLDSENQRIYVWFLIVFPSFLITLFFLTLNFNNKSLYTPADFSKEKTHLKIQAVTPQPHAEQTLSLTTQEPSPLALQAGSKFSPYHPQSAIVLPQAYKACEREASTPVSPDDGAFSACAAPHLLLDGYALKSLYMIDLSRPGSSFTHTRTRDDVLRSHYEMTRKHASDVNQHGVLLVLTNNQWDITSSLESLCAKTHHNTPPFIQTTVITYNTDTQKLNTMS